MFICGTTVNVFCFINWNMCNALIWTDALLKHKVNRCVLSLHLNEYKLSASWTGRLFHTTGSATKKFLSLEQYSQCWTPNGDVSVPDNCCTPAPNRWGSLGSDVCGLLTSPVPAWIRFCIRRVASVAPSGLGIRGHTATIPEVNDQKSITVVESAEDEGAD